MLTVTTEQSLSGQHCILILALKEIGFLSQSRDRVKYDCNLQTFWVFIIANIWLHSSVALESQPEKNQQNPNC